jgi:hypothetical protein
MRLTAPLAAEAGRATIRKPPPHHAPRAKSDAPPGPDIRPPKQIHLDRRIDGNEILDARDDGWRVRVGDRLETIRRATDRVVETPRSDRNATGNGTSIGQRASFLKLRNGIADQSRMNAQIAARPQAAQNRARNLAQSGLYGRAVPYPSGDMLGNRVSDRMIAVRFRKAQHFLLAFNHRG